MSQDDCKNCHKAGLAILPVRYAVVPDALPNTLPRALKATGVKDLALAKHHYALRTLRQGFLYLFFEKRWGNAAINVGADPTLTRCFRSYEVYSVAENGTLWRQPHAYAVAAVYEPVCKDTAHHVPTTVITIANPEKSGIVWIAFSEHLWSPETLAAYGNDAALRARRMQKLDPAAWIASQQHDHGLLADPQTVEEVVEYAPRVPLEILPQTYVGPEPPLTDDNGRHTQAILASVSSRYRVAQRAKQAGETVKCMRAFGKFHPEKEPHPPLVLALTDAIGAAHELNGFRNEPVGRVEQYQKEREMELSALTNIKGLENALKTKATDAQERTQDRIRRTDSVSAEFIAARRARAAALGEPKRSQEIEICAILEDWAARQVPSWYEQRLDRANGSAEPARSREIAALRREVDEFLATRQKNGEANIRNAEQNSWASYAKRIDKNKRELFEKNYTAFGTAVAQLVDERTDDLLVWLKSTALLDTLTEYYNDSIEDSVAFEDKVGNALLGIGSSPKGAQQLEQWVAEAKVTEKNLLWRTVALNHTKSAEELSQALQEAEQYKNERTLASALKWADRAGNSLKAFASTHKNAARIYATNAKAAAAGGSTAHGVPLRPVNTRDIDYLAMATCDKIVRFFRVDRLGEYASEKVIQHIFSLRAFADPEDSARLIQAQAEYAEAVRVQMLERQRAGAALLATDQPPLKTTQSESLRRAWAEFKSEAHAKDSVRGVLKDCRVSILVLLIEGFNFSKLLGDCYRKNDAKSWITLSASAMTMTSALFDVATVPAKELFVSDSMSLQRLKLAGGLLAAGATMVGVYYDWEAKGNAAKSGDIGLERLYLLKAVGGGLGAGATLLSTFTYAAPLIGRLTGSATLQQAALTTGSRAAAAIGFRILFMSAGAWITVGTFTIQIFIWKFYPDDLEKWLEKCALGADRDRGWTANRQQDELTNALESVGLSEKKP